MIDTHSHMYADAFNEDIEEAIERAKTAGLDKILLPNIDVDSISGLNQLVERHQGFFYPMMGLHPCSVTEDYKSNLELIKKELDRTECVAVGEIGVDLYWDKTKQKIQEEAFLIQCQWALEKDLPIVIHSRESTRIIIDLIQAHFRNKLTGVFHCFVGDAMEAQEIIDMGYYLGIGGVVTFKNSGLRNHLGEVPLDKILIETDSPYLAPTPYRGKRNESAYIVQVVKELSFIYNVPELEIKNITTENALKLFKL
ncbi:MAG: hydrolase TatD [Bacteroidetes bacterium]|nr:MAG: hydrolase TatD [Bacteroidota bacterium]